MKIEKENVIIDQDKSFKIFYPSLRDYFYWHYHPELELIYIEGFTGIRHVGQHISSFMDSDLVLIGSNIPHLNFDYGLKTNYKQVVVQLCESFIYDTISSTPEFNNLSKLFNRSVYGLAFHGETKRMVAEKLTSIEPLNNFERIINLLEIFQILSESTEYVQLNDEDTSVKLYLNDKVRMGTVYDYIYKHYSNHTDVNEIAGQVGLSTSAFCRYFKKQTKMTFTDFVNQYRINLAKTMLLGDITVSQVCYNVGFQSLSHFNKLFNKYVGMGPLKFQKAFSNDENNVHTSAFI